MKKINFKPYYPYAQLKNFIFNFKKIKNLNETDAILLSFIYNASTSEETRTEKFKKKFLSSFNLNEEFWELFENKIKTLIDVNVVSFSGKVINDTTICDDFTVNEDICKYLKQNKFFGLEKSVITKENTFEYEVKKQFMINQNNSSSFVNNHFPNIIKLISSNNDDYVERMKEHHKKDQSDLVYVNLNDKNKQVDLVWKQANHFELKYEFKNDIVDLYISDAQLIDYFAFIADNEALGIIKHSFNESLIKIQSIKSYTQEEQKNNNFSFVDFSNYYSIKNKNEQFIKNFSYLEKNNLYIDEENKSIKEIIYKPSTLRINTNTNPINLDNIVILYEVEYCSIYKFVKVLLEKNEYRNLTLLFKYLSTDELNDVVKIILENKALFLDVNYQEYKNFLLNNIFIDNKINNTYLEISLISNNISDADWRLLINNNPVKIKKFLVLSEVKSTDYNLFKIDLAIDLLDIDPFSIKYESSFKKEINDFKNLIKSSADDWIKLDFYLKEIEKSKSKKWMLYELNSLKYQIEILQKKDKDFLYVLYQKFIKKTSKIEEIFDESNLKNVEEKIKDSSIKKQFKEMRQKRNEIAHSSNHVKLENIKKDIESVNNLIQFANDFILNHKKYTKTKEKEEK